MEEGDVAKIGTCFPNNSYRVVRIEGGNAIDGVEQKNRQRGGRTNETFIT